MKKNFKHNLKLMGMIASLLLVIFVVFFLTIICFPFYRELFIIVCEGINKFLSSII